MLYELYMIKLSQQEITVNEEMSPNHTQTINHYNQYKESIEYNKLRIIQSESFKNGNEA